MRRMSGDHHGTQQQRNNSLPESRRNSLLLSVFENMLPAKPHSVDQVHHDDLDPFAPLSIHDALLGPAAAAGSTMDHHVEVRKPSSTAMVLSDKSESSGHSMPSQTSSHGSVMATATSDNFHPVSPVKSMRYDGLPPHPPSTHGSGGYGSRHHHYDMPMAISPARSSTSYQQHHSMMMHHHTLSPYGRQISPMDHSMASARSTYPSMTTPSSRSSSSAFCSPPSRYVRSLAGLPPPPIIGSNNSSSSPLSVAAAASRHAISAVAAATLRELDRHCHGPHLDDDDNDDDEGGPQRFKPFHEEKWSSRYKELLDFHREHGHAAVPHTYPSNPQLARWVKRQRRQFKLRAENRPSTMTMERLDLLNSVGFIWDSHEVNWCEKLDNLRAFRRQHGHCNVPSNYCDKKLATWIKCQRRQHKLMRDSKPSAMTHDRILQLEKMGFEWEIRASAMSLNDSSRSLLDDSVRSDAVSAVMHDDYALLF